MPVPEVNSVLADAAFGPTPGRAAVELPVPSDATESWLRAVALGGVGHYAAARTQLARTRRLTRDPVLLSLTLSTEGSLLRQLGWHARAAALDGRAAALVLPDAPVREDRATAQPHGVARATAQLPAVDRATAQDPVVARTTAHPSTAVRAEAVRNLAPRPSDIARAEAVCDALTGLAADALGTARPALAARLLDRCRTHLPAAEDSWRPLIRLHWVSAETALSAPGSGLVAAPDSASAVADPALAHAEAAVALAQRCPSVRHRVKSGLLLAAASAATGDLDRSRLLAAEVARECREFDLLPLRWACAMLRSGIDPVGDGAAEAAECARLLGLRGGGLRSAS